MGRARNAKMATTVAGPRYSMQTNQPSGANRYREFLHKKLRVHYLTCDDELKAALEEITALAPTRIAVDFETASKNGKWGVMNGSLSLVQLGVDEPGIEPRQWLIDCRDCDPR